MKKLLLSLLLFCTITTLTTQASAVSLSIVPSTSPINVGDLVDVDILISGIDDPTGSGPYLGAYSIGIKYDQTILQESGSVSFDTLLLGALSDSVRSEGHNPGAGQVEAEETSTFVDPADLAFLQFDNHSFNLVTFHFTGLNSGTSPLTFYLTDLSDADGNVLGVDPVVASQIVVNGPSGVVPEPSTVLLLATGVAGLLWQRRKAGHAK
jgi:hypothetical protein